MKKIPILLIVFTLVLSSCTNDDGSIIPESKSLEYELLQVDPDNVLVRISAVSDVDTDFAVSSFVPNSKTVNVGGFDTNESLTGTVGDIDLSNQSASVNKSFDLLINGISDGMNYFNIEIDNGNIKKFFSFQINRNSLNGEINYLAVISNRRDDNDTNYEEAIFRMDFHSNTSFRVLTGREGPTNILYDNLINDSSDFKFVTSGGATEILKTYFEEL